MRRENSSLRNSLIVGALAIFFMAGGAVLWEHMRPITTEHLGDSNKTEGSNHKGFSWNGNVAYAASVGALNQEYESPFVSVAETLKPSVVNISVEKIRRDPHEGISQFDPFREFFERQRERAPQKRTVPSSGTGFIIDKRGYVLINNHVVENADKITVELIDGEREAKLIGADPETDLAVLDIGSVKEDHVAMLGNSDDIRIGEWAVAMGNALGLEWTLSVGVISAKGRSNLNIMGGGPSFQDFIQTDASINFGNSGGPLTNIRGEVIGINSAINASGNNIGFAIPINLAKEVVAQLLDGGSVTRGYLGMVPVELDALRKEALGLDEKLEGVLVESVQPDTPADDGGLVAGDVVVEIEGKPVSEVTDFRFRVARVKPGKKLELTILRNGEKKKKLDFVLGDRAEYIAQARSPKVINKELDWMGIKVVSLNSNQAKQRDIDVKNGVMIVELSADSPARGKLQPGDVIVKVGPVVVDNLDDWEKVSQELGDTERATLILYHSGGRGGTRFVAIKK